MSLVIMETSNVIIAPIEIKLDKLEKLETIVQRMRTADAKIPKRDQTLSSDEDTSIEDKLSQLFSKTVGNSPAGGVRNAMRLVQNPMGFIMGIVSNPVVAGAILAAASAKMILDILMMHGNVLDKHFKRLLVAEDIKSRSRQSRQALRTGLGDQAIFTNASGSTAPQYAFNSYAAVRDGSIRGMKAFQIRRGYRF